MEYTWGPHKNRAPHYRRGAELYQNSATAPVATSSGAVTKKITRLLGMTRDEFFNTYFTGQKELAVMAALGPADRGRFLSRVLGYERLKVAQDAARLARGQLRAELAGLEQGLGDPGELEHERKQAEERRTEAQRAVDHATSVRDRAVKALAVVGPEWTRMVEVRQKALALD